MQNPKSARFIFLFIVLAVCYAQRANSQAHVYQTIADGNWTSNASWQHGLSGKPPVSGNCDCIININPGHRVTINQSVNISNAKIILLGEGSELRFASAIILPQTMQLNGNSSIELRSAGASIESTSNFFGFNGNTISINGTKVFQGHGTQVNSGTSGVVSGPAMASASMSPPLFINQLLPVKLIEFAATAFQGKVVLKWKTAEQLNFGRFEVERSLNGKGWSTIGAINGRRETHANIVYSFTDLSPAAGVNYYRLKMIDLDDAFGYSPIKTARAEANMEITIFPNPATDYVMVSPKNGSANLNIQVIGQHGQLLKQVNGTGIQRIALNGLKPGLYIVNVAEENGSVKRLKLLIH